MVLLVESNTQNELEKDAKGIVDENMQKFMRKFITDLEVNPILERQ